MLVWVSTEIVCETDQEEGGEGVDFLGFCHRWVRADRASARHVNLIEHHAHNRLALFVAKSHQRSRAYGWRLVTDSSPNRLGLISVSGTVVAPRPHRAWRGK